MLTPLRHTPLRLLAALVLGGLVLAGPNPVGTRAQSGPDGSAAWVAVQVRLADGTPVAGVTVQLALAPADWGGLPAATAPVRPGVTDAQGRALLAGLGTAVWLVSFAGTVQGRALVPATQQGRPPYGRTRAGGGFPLAAEADLGDETADGPPVEEHAFVLLAGPDGWLPSLDLAAADGPPAPLATLPLAPALRQPAPTPERVVAPPPDQAANPLDPAADHLAAPGPDPGVGGLVSGLALLGLVAAWWRRIKRRPQQGKGRR